MVTIEVNGRAVDAQDGETILSAVRRAGVAIPTLCHYEGLPPSGACRMCVVDVEGQRGLVPSCAYPVAPGMKVRTHSPRAVDARTTLVELLLANHPDDCLYCSRSGDCQLQSIAQQLGVRRRRYFGGRTHARKDVASPSIVRDPAKCILCGKCVRVCEEIQTVGAIEFIGRGSRAHIGPAFDEGLNVSSCVNCGQCVAVCPTGALAEHSALEDVRAALSDPGKYVVVQHAPSVSVSLAEAFGAKPGADVDGALTAAFRRLGFKRVFDTAFTADLTIMEEASELVQRLTAGDAAAPADDDQLLAGVDQVRRAVLPGHDPAPLHLQEPAADARRRHQELLRRRASRSTRRASTAWRSCRAPPRSSRPAGPRWGATADPTSTRC